MIPNEKLINYVSPIHFGCSISESMSVFYGRAITVNELWQGSVGEEGNHGSAISTKKHHFFSSGKGSIPLGPLVNSYCFQLLVHLISSWI